MTSTTSPIPTRAPAAPADHADPIIGAYHIALVDLVTNRMYVLTSTELDESPSIAPNGSMVLYATKYAEQGILAAVSVDGGVKFRLPAREGDVREPAWSPYMHRRP